MAGTGERVDNQARRERQNSRVEGFGFEESIFRETIDRTMYELTLI